MDAVYVRRQRSAIAGRFMQGIYDNTCKAVALTSKRWATVAAMPTLPCLAAASIPAQIRVDLYCVH